jgi:hypothetical protein
MVMGSFIGIIPAVVTLSVAASTFDQLNPSQKKKARELKRKRIRSVALAKAKKAKRATAGKKNRNGPAAKRRLRNRM